MRLDPKAEFCRRDRRTIRCGRCAKPSQARSDSDLERFKEHRKSKSCKAGSSNQPSIEHFFTVASCPVKCSATKKPCPGLRDVDHPLISQYLSRTVVSSGGAPPRPVLKQLIIREHRHQLRRRKLTRKELKLRVLTSERAQAKWLNEHNLGSVFSPKCHRECNEKDGNPMPCTSCLQILRFKSFRNAVRRKLPKRGNAKFTPKAFRNEVLGQAYMRHRDVQELMEEVHISNRHLTQHFFKLFP